MVVCCFFGSFAGVGSEMPGSAASFCLLSRISRNSSRTEGRSSGDLAVPSAVLLCFSEVGADGRDFSVFAAAGFGDACSSF